MKTPLTPRRVVLSPHRGIDPERLDMLAGFLDRQMAEMFGLAVQDKPIRGKKVKRLLDVVRVTIAALGRFENEIEAAL